MSAKSQPQKTRGRRSGERPERRRVTQETINEMAALRRQGLPFVEIATRVERRVIRRKLTAIERASKNRPTALHGMDARSPSQHRRHDVTLHPFAGSIDRAHTVDPLDSALLVLQSYTSLHH
jgi:hypothetical protein